MTQAIYVMKAPDQVKVGISNSPKTRRLALSIDTKLDLVIAYSAFPGDKNARSLEKRAHELLADWSLGGEWFRASAEDAIAAVIQAAKELGLTLSDHRDGRVPILFRAEPDIKDALDEAAINDNRSLANLVEKIITEHVRGYLPEPKPKRAKK